MGGWRATPHNGQPFLQFQYPFYAVLSSKMPQGCIAKVCREELNGAHAQEVATQFAVSFSVCFAQSMQLLDASWQAAMTPQASDEVVEVDWDSNSECDDFSDTSSNSSFEVLDDMAVNQVCVDNVTSAHAKTGNKKSRKSKAKREANINKAKKDVVGDALPEGVWFTKTSKRGARLATTGDVGPHWRT